MLRNGSKILCLLSFILIYSTPIYSQISQEEATHIDTLMHSFMHAYETHDLSALKNIYHENAVIIGTGSDEIIQGRDKIIAGFERDFKQSTQATIKIEKIAIDGDNDAAFASYKVLVNVQIPKQKPFLSTLRFSVGLVKENHHWVVLQSHLSAPLIEEKPGESFPTT